MVENNYIVYIHRNKINNKCYIGITCQKPNQRWINGKGYMGKRKNGDYSQPKFAHAIEKYGWDNFEHIIWAEGLTRDKACEAERLLIDLWDTINNGYNSLPGGINNVLSWESKQKLGKSQKQIWENEEFRKRMSEAHLGHKISEEHRQKLIAANTNRKMSQHTKERLNESRRKKVIQYTKDGKFIKVWDSMTEAANSLRINPKQISNVCRLPERYKTAGGFVWRFYTEEFKEVA